MPRRDNGSNPRPSPDERYREFAEENERWNRRIEEALTELDESVPEPPPSKTEPTPA